MLCFTLTGLSACGRHAHGTGAAPAPAISGVDLARGKALYERECSACHGASGVDGPIGPVLQNERARKTFEQVLAIVTDPQPPMPKLYPSKLTRGDLRDVSAYVESL